MVDHQHLSAGNSESSHSCDLFAEFGVSNPNSPTAFVAMVESEPITSNISISSDESNAFDAQLGESFGPASTSVAQDIFKAAHFFSRNDRDDALAEKRKNAKLMDYISTLGLPLDDVNNMSTIGTSAVLGNARKVFDSCPVFGRSSSKAASHLVSGSLLVFEAVLPSPPVQEKVDSLEKADSLSIPPKSWSSVVSNSAFEKILGLSFFPPEPSEGSVMVKPSIVVLKLGLNKWSTSLVGHFIHSKLPFKLVETSAKKLWGTLGLSKVYLHDKGNFIFKFNSVSDRDNVLATGPWYIASKLLFLQPWQEGVNFVDTECSKVPICVKFSNIPLSYWTKEGLSYLASAIGRPLFEDDMTSKLEPMCFT